MTGRQAPPVHKVRKGNAEQTVCQVRLERLERMEQTAPQVNPAPQVLLVRPAPRELTGRQVLPAHKAPSGRSVPQVHKESRVSLVPRAHKGNPDHKAILVRLAWRGHKVRLGRQVLRVCQGNLAPAV